MYTFELPILYPEVALRGVTLRSVSNLNKFKLFALESTDTVRFFVWWLFLHRRLRIRQRGSASENASDLCTHMADHFQRALSVFIRTTQLTLRPTQQAFRLRFQAIMASRFPPFDAADGVLPQLVAFPESGQNARKQSRLCLEFTPVIFEVK